MKQKCGINGQDLKERHALEVADIQRIASEVILASIYYYVPCVTFAKYSLESFGVTISV